MASRSILLKRWYLSRKPVVWYFILILLISIFFFFFKSPDSRGIQDFVAHVSTWIIVFLFLISLVYLLVFCLLLLKNVKWSKYKKFDWLALLISLVPVYFNFFRFKSLIVGRFIILEVLEGYIFRRPYFDAWFFDPRTFTTPFYSILEFFGLHVTPFVLTFFNRIWSIIAVLLFYFILKHITKKKWLSFFTTLILATTTYFILDSISIEAMMWSLCFTLLSIYLLFKAKNKITLPFIAAVVIAASSRYELSLLFGIPLMFYLLFFKNKKDLSDLWIIFVVIMLILPIPVIHHYSSTTDPFLKGQNSGFISSALARIHNSLIVRKDWQPDKNYVSFFYYLTWILSFVYLDLLFNKKFLKKNHVVYLFVFYFIFYNLILVSFQIEGLSSPVKYNINFYLMELLIIAYSLKFFKEYLSLVLLAVIFIAAIYFNHFFFFNFDNFGNEFRNQELHMVQGVSLDPSCKIIKAWARYPYFDYYVGKMKQTVFCGDRHFFDNLNRFFKQWGCYYFYNGHYTKGEYLREAIAYLPLTRVISLAKSDGCTVSTKFFGEVKNTTISLTRIDCK